MIRVISEDGKPLPPPQLEWGEVTDPAEIAESRAVHEAALRNGDWLATHWPDLLPQAYGKYVAVAGQQAFLADSVQEALALAKAAHPDDKGVLIQYVIPPGTVTIYGIQG
jgi:hypothetical protein